MSQQFCLKWNNHMNNMMDVFKNLLSTEAMVDVTLACDGLSLKAHKIVLSACSPFFQSLFLENPCKHPIVILKDMKYTELKAIIEFMYHGEVNVAQDQLSALMKTAETLRVKGLAEVTNEKNQSSSQDESSSHRSVPRTDTPPPKRRRGRTRKRSMSDQSDDEASEPKIKQPDSPEIEELSGDMDTNTQYSNTSSVPLQSHSTNSFHNKSSSQQEQPVDQGADESFAPEEKFNVVEPSKLLEQTLTTDDLPRRGSRSSVQSNMELQRRSRSTDHSTALVPTSMPSDALVVANQQPESPPDIKPELLDLEPPMSPVAGPSHSTDENSMMMYMDQSSMSGMPGPSGYQDNSALVSTDSQPQVYSQNIGFSITNMQNLTPEERNQIEICISSVQSLQLRKQTEDIPPLLKPDWEQDFEVDWDDLSKDILYQLNNGKKLTPRDKREFVRFLGKCIMNFCPRPKRKNIVGIVQKVVNKFPNSLSDTWCEETAGVGYEGLLRRVIYRIENLNRNMYSYTPKSDPEGKKKRTPSYKFYGCTNWQPMIFDYESHVLEQKRETLKERFAIEGKAFDSVSSDLMRETYKLQRKDINEGNDISKLMFEWPYLFTIEGLLGHFSELVGIDLRNKLEKTLSTKGNMIFTHLSKISDKPLKNEKLKTTMFELLMEKEGAEKIISDVSGLLTIIAEYFEERKESLYMVMESSLTQKEIERILNLQDVFSPLIVVRGTSPVSYENCMLCVNRKVLIEEIGSFKDAFLGLFCLFYCLNIEYPVSAVATLEFVQRCFFNINASGSKCQKRSKWRMNMKVTKLIEMLSEYD